MDFNKLILTNLKYLKQIFIKFNQSQSKNMEHTIFSLNNTNCHNFKPSKIWNIKTKSSNINTLKIYLHGKDFSKLLHAFKNKTIYMFKWILQQIYAIKCTTIFRHLNVSIKWMNSKEDILQLSTFYILPIESLSPYQCASKNAVIALYQGF